MGNGRWAMGNGAKRRVLKLEGRCEMRKILLFGDRVHVRRRSGHHPGASTSRPRWNRDALAQRLRCAAGSVESFQHGGRASALAAALGRADITVRVDGGVARASIALEGEVFHSSMVRVPLHRRDDAARRTAG